MPKATRQRHQLVHNPSPKPSKRKFAVQDNAAEHVKVGSLINTPANEILAGAAESDESSKHMKKKEKQAMKHDLFVQRLESSRSPYSKSHERRLKRKAKEQVANGMNDIQLALSAVAGELTGAADTSIQDSDVEAVVVPPQPKPGQIGEGKSEPLNKFQRRKALKTERLRIPMILKTPEFASNPFQTIRTHAQNTLVKHQASA